MREIGRAVLENYVDWNWSWTVDGALRYAPVIHAIFAAQFTAPLICDIGAGTRGGITSYANTEAIGVDLSYERKETRRLVKKYPRLRPVCASATRLPLKSGTFDFVVCIDTLEHLSRDNRSIVLGELFRIAKDDGWVIVGAPCGPEARNCDETMNRHFRRRRGTDHPWLREHLLHEPILQEWFEKQLTRRVEDRFDGYYMFSLGNVSIRLRHILGDLLWGSLHLNQFQRLLFRPLLFFLTWQNREPCYRRIYFIHGEG